MKVLKNMEVLFTVGAAFACAAAYVSVTQPQAPANAGVALIAPLVAPVASGEGADNIQVVVVRGKRMTAEEKAQSLQDERKQTLLAINESKA